MQQSLRVHVLTLHQGLNYCCYTMVQSQGNILPPYEHDTSHVTMVELG